MELLIEVLTYQLGRVEILLVVCVFLFLAMFFQARDYRKLRLKYEALKGQKAAPLTSSLSDEVVVTNIVRQ